VRFRDELNRNKKRTSRMMLRLLIISILALPALAIGTLISNADELRVQPILLEMNEPARTGSLTLHNPQGRQMVVQTRVMRWSQANGKETLEPTTGVVASPPVVTLSAGADYTIRIVRVLKEPVQGEESYRVFVDQLPNIRKSNDNAVNFLIRQSIPVFFRSQQLSRPSVSWSYGYDSGKLVVTGTNNGDERLRIANLRLRDTAGMDINFGNGLVGYVLGHSSMSWLVPRPPKGFGVSGSVSVTAQSDKGPVNAVAHSRDRR
jgi:fimbrial chaperone protein